MTSIRPVKVNHMNVVLENVDASLEHFQRLYGARLVVDIPQKEMHAYLFELGRVIFEVFVPCEFLLNARYGPHYLGVEYQADMETVRQAIAERSIRTARDIGVALHTHPEDCFGVAFEFYEGEFHNRDWAELGGNGLESAAYWRDEHPLGLTGQRGFTLAVSDISAAESFLQSFLSAERVYEERRDELSARAVGLKIADGTVELLTPDGPGKLADHLRRYGDGIRSTIFSVEDITRARTFLAERGIALEPGTTPGSIAVPASANLGVIFEFAE